jgi:hypothetical protein
MKNQAGRFDKDFEKIWIYRTSSEMKPLYVKEFSDRKIYHSSGS